MFLSDSVIDLQTRRRKGKTDKVLGPGNEHLQHPQNPSLHRGVWRPLSHIMSAALCASQILATPRIISLRCDFTVALAPLGTGTAAAPGRTMDLE